MAALRLAEMASVEGNYLQDGSELGVTPPSVSDVYLIIAPDGIGAGGYLDQKLEDRTLQIIEGVRP